MIWKVPFFFLLLLLRFEKHPLFLRTLGAEAETEVFGLTVSCLVAGGLAVFSSTTTQTDKIHLEAENTEKDFRSNLK